MNTKYKILKALFAEAKRLGIGQETLRDDITPGVINKRLSAASPQEIARVLVYIHNRHGIEEGRKTRDERGEKAEGGRMKAEKRPDSSFIPHPSSLIRRPSYESSRAGLLEEIRDLAIARFGADYALPLNAFCARFGEPDGFRKMRVNQMKIIKQRLKELQREDPRNQIVQTGLKPVSTGTEQETQNTKQETQNSKVITFQKGRKGFFDQLRGL